MSTPQVIAWKVFGLAVIFYEVKKKDTPHYPDTILFLAAAVVFLVHRCGRKGKQQHPGCSWPVSWLCNFTGIPVRSCSLSTKLHLTWSKTSKNYVSEWVTPIIFFLLISLCRQATQIITTDQMLAPSSCVEHVRKCQIDKFFEFQRISWLKPQWFTPGEVNQVCKTSTEILDCYTSASVVRMCHLVLCGLCVRLSPPAEFTCCHTRSL